MRRRVVITGMGCVTPLGVDLDTVWRRIAAGESGVAPITLFDTTGFPVRIAAEVKEWGAASIDEPPPSWRALPRQTQFAVAAADQAARHAQWTRNTGDDPLRTGVCFGCGEVFPEFSDLVNVVSAGRIQRAENAHAGSHAAATHGSTGHSSNVALLCAGGRSDDDLLLEPGLAASLIASRWNAQGPTSNFTAACVSSSQAIGEAAETIRRGEADAMFCGGAHSMIHPLGVTGFHRLSTLSTRSDQPERAARPFDAHRDGFVVGEGGAALLLESLEHAERRGAPILAELTGFASTHDAYRITDLEPRGRSAIRCLESALADAGLSPDKIAYINAHGSATVVNDRVETHVVKQAFGQAAERVRISSTKSMTGHLTTACGAIETVLTVLALQHAIAPPTINLETPDPDCDLDYVPLVAKPLDDPRHAMNNNFGFGGQNVSLIVSRFPAQ